MDSSDLAQWIEWHIDTRIIPTDSRGVTLRLIKDDVICGEVPVSPAELANLARRYTAKLEAQQAAASAAEDDEG